MSTRARRALLKLAQAKNPGFSDSFKNWGESLVDGKQGTSMPHFNAMMNSDAMQNVGKSFNAYTNSAGNFVKSFSDNTPGSTWNAFKAMHTGEGAPFAYGINYGVPLAMATAFNNSNNAGGGGGGLSTLNTAVSILPGMMPYILGYGLYKNWAPKIQNFFKEWGPKIQNGIKAGWDARDIIKYKTGNGSMLAATGNVSDIRNDPKKTERVLNASLDASKATGNFDFYREARKRFGGTADEWAANAQGLEGIGELGGATLTRGDFSGIVAKGKQWYRNIVPDLKIDQQQDDQEVQATQSTVMTPSGAVPVAVPSFLNFAQTAQKAKSMGMTQADLDRLNSSMRTGTINGSMPVYDIKVNVPANANTFDQQRNLVQQLRNSGSLNEQAYQKRMADIARRQQEYNNSVQEHKDFMAENAGKTHDDFYNEALSSSGDRNWASEYARLQSEKSQAPKAPSKVNVATNKPAVWSKPDDREFKNGYVQIKSSDDLKKMYGNK